jgi:hypothetical protein
MAGWGYLPDKAAPGGTAGVRGKFPRGVAGMPGLVVGRVGMDGIGARSSGNQHPKICAGML